MKALTLTQPWATLVAIGAKQFETRSWRSNYRGPLAIHAAKGFPKSAQSLCGLPPFLGALVGSNQEFYAQSPGSLVHRLPTASIVAVCTLAGCRPIMDEDWPEEPERSFGNYSTPGRFAWRLIDVRALATPVPATGALGLWALSPELVAAVEREVRE